MTVRTHPRRLAHAVLLAAVLSGGLCHAQAPGVQVPPDQKHLGEMPWDRWAREQAERQRQEARKHTEQETAQAEAKLRQEVQAETKQQQEKAKKQAEQEKAQARAAQEKVRAQAEAKRQQEAQARAAQTKGAPPGISLPAPVAAVPPAVPVADSLTYFVQIGAFRTSEEAEGQRARLLQHGVQAQISERDQAGRTMYRVRVGPFQSYDAAERVKTRLVNDGFDAALARVPREQKAQERANPSPGSAPAVDPYAHLIAFTTRMSGASAVPPADSAATGQLDALYDSSSGLLRWKAVWSDLRGPITAVQFRGPAGSGQNAPPTVIWPAPFGPTYEGRATLTPRLADDLLAGRWYVNVTTYPAGEMRGQLQQVAQDQLPQVLRKVWSDYEEAKPQQQPSPEEKLRTAAQGGDAKAEYELGEIYLKSKDYEQAFVWYRKAAEHGHARAQYELGKMYHFDTYGHQNYEQAFVWYLKAAENTKDEIVQADAYRMLGIMYAQGSGVPRDCIKAVDSWKKSGDWTLYAGAYFPWEETKVKNAFASCTRAQKKENATYSN